MIPTERNLSITTIFWRVDGTRAPILCLRCNIDCIKTRFINPAASNTKANALLMYKEVPFILCLEYFYTPFLVFHRI